LKELLYKIIFFKKPTNLFYSPTSLINEWALTHGQQNYLHTLLHEKEGQVYSKLIISLLQEFPITQNVEQEQNSKEIP